jgi:beta-fructofuranosidase
MWECPDLIDLGDGNYLLIYSGAGHFVFYKLGTLDQDGLTFLPYDAFVNDGLVLDFGAFYAARSFEDPKNGGVRTLWGWIRETRPDVELEAAGWAGLMSVPRSLGIQIGSDLEPRLLMKPHQQVNTLRSSN